MDDRFKFKAIGLQTKEVIYVDCLYWFEENGIHSIEDGIGKGPYEHYHILQCTGLKDKNGRLIYEGDILKTVSGRIVKVKFGKTGYNSEFTFCAVGFFLESKGFWGEDYINFRETPYYEVIGNIHEKPELLEGQK